MGRIKIERGDSFIKEFFSLINDIKAILGITEKEIAQLLSIHPDLLHHYKKGRKIPLGIIIKLIKLWEVECKKSEPEVVKKIHHIQDNIKELSHATGKYFKITKCPHYLTENLCKIAGTIVADGNLQLIKRTNSYGKTYQIGVTEQYEDNLNNFCKQIESEFGIRLKPKFDNKNHCWFIRFCNKVIFLYLNKLFEIPYGDKSAIVKMPTIIGAASLNYKIAFTKGVVMFDGGLSFRTHSYVIASKSIRLIDDIKSVLISCGIVSKFIKYDTDSKNTHQLRIRDKKMLELLLKIFIEPKTIKWTQLNFILNGWQNLPKSLDEISKVIEKVYPRKSHWTNLNDIIEIVRTLDKAKTKDIHKHFNLKHQRSLFEYLKALEDWNVLKSSREGVYKVWCINPNLKQN